MPPRAGAAGGPDDDIDIAAEGGEQPQQALDGKTAQQIGKIGLCHAGDGGEDLIDRAQVNCHSTQMADVYAGALSKFLRDK